MEYHLEVLGSCEGEFFFFAWEVSWSRILTIDQLKRRGWNILNGCYLCKEEEETTDHLLMFCGKVRML